MRALLDVNVLIALLDSGHAMHGRAMDWLAREAQLGWATCPITQNGVVRIMSQPGYPTPRPAAQVAHRLGLACASVEHAFWPDDINLLATGLIDWQRVLGHRQVTDTYLLALCVQNNGRFVTFDQRIKPSVVNGATAAHLALIA
jgi:toxin-antitoxin system PIN domain toxin